MHPTTGFHPSEYVRIYSFCLPRSTKVCRTTSRATATPQQLTNHGFTCWPAKGHGSGMTRPLHMTPAPIFLALPFPRLDRWSLEAFGAKQKLCLQVKLLEVWKHFQPNIFVGQIEVKHQKVCTNVGQYHPIPIKRPHFCSPATIEKTLWKIDRYQKHHLSFESDLAPCKRFTESAVLGNYYTSNSLSPATLGYCKVVPRKGQHLMSHGKGPSQVFVWIWRA